MEIREKKVDSREPEEARNKLLELGWIQQQLDFGDFEFMAYDMKTVGITRKFIDDLLHSLNAKGDPSLAARKGKLFGQQLGEMLDVYDINIILVEGSWKMISPQQQLVSGRGVERYTWDSIWNFLRTWQDKGFTLELTANLGHTIHRLNSLYAYYSEPYHTGGINRRNIIGDPRLLAMDCEGVGMKYRQMVLDHFGSLRAIANASIEDFLKIEGIGEQRATSLVMHFAKDTRKEKSNGK